MSEENTEDFLGRFEAQTMSGFIAYLEIVPLPEGGYSYSYGVGKFPPRETINVPTAEEMRARFNKAAATGYRKTKNISDLIAEQEMTAAVRGFDFMSWMAGGATK